MKNLASVLILVGTSQLIDLSPRNEYCRWLEKPEDGPKAKSMEQMSHGLSVEVSPRKKHKSTRHV